MSFNAQDVLRRLAALERANRPPPSRVLHEVETIEPAGVVSTDMLTLHSAEEFGVWLVPLRFDGEIVVSKVSAVVERTGVPSAEAGLAIYRATQLGNYDRRESGPASGVTYVRQRIVGTFVTTSATPVRFNKVLDPPLVMNSAHGHWAVGVQGVAATEWFCPGSSGAMLASRVSRRTYPLGTAVGDFPERLTTQNSDRQCPWVVLRSATGVQLFEYHAD